MISIHKCMMGGRQCGSTPPPASKNYLTCGKIANARRITVHHIVDIVNICGGPLRQNNSLKLQLRRGYMNYLQCAFVTRRTAYLGAGALGEWAPMTGLGSVDRSTGAERDFC